MLSVFFIYGGDIYATFVDFVSSIVYCSSFTVQILYRLKEITWFRKAIRFHLMLATASAPRTKQDNLYGTNE